MSLERYLSAVRALVARELVARGLSVNETARLLGLTPAAVSMYVAGKRGGDLVNELARDEGVMAIIKSHCDAIVDMAARGAKGPVDLTELAKVVARLVEQRRPEARLEDLIRERIRLEQETATRAMAYSYKTRNPLVRALFMQIATDSLRHAEILTLILDYLGGRVKAEEVDLSSEELEKLAEEEWEMRESLAELYRSLSPLVRALVLSIELDEQKHYQLIKALQLAAGRGGGQA